MDLVVTKQSKIERAMARLDERQNATQKGNTNDTPRRH
jgi:hypothetical protein